MRIACLHTAPGNAAIFAREGEKLGCVLRHDVRSDLLERAEQQGGLTDAIRKDTADALARLASNSDAVLLTCSTIGPAVEDARGLVDIPVLRVDEALARDAVSRGGRVVVLCAVETTLGPTESLFRDAAKDTGALIEVRLVKGAWAEFRAGRPDRYHAIVAQAADEAYRGGAKVVALAQASMTGAAKLARLGKPLTSPAIGLKAAFESARSALKAARGHGR
jgi:Asp/Glu/hydantoin racemase